MPHGENRTGDTLSAEPPRPWRHVVFGSRGASREDREWYEDANGPTRWSMGVLNDKKTVEVPGSVLLLASDHNEPLGLRVAPARTSHSSLPTGMPHQEPLPASEKKTTGDGKFILDPQPEDSANDPLNWPAWRRDAALLSLGFFCMVGGGMTPVLAAGFTNVAHDYGIAVDRVSLTTGLFMMGMGLGSVVFSPTAILYGKRPVYLFGACLFVLTSIWCALSPNFLSLLLARIIQGVAVSPVECLPSATIAEIFFLHERAYRIGIYTLLLLGGKNLVPLVSAAIIQKLSWRWVFWIAAGIVGFCGLLLFFFVPETFWDRTPLPKSRKPTRPSLFSRLSSYRGEALGAGLHPGVSPTSPGSEVRDVTRAVPHSNKGHVGFAPDLPPSCENEASPTAGPGTMLGPSTGHELGVNQRQSAGAACAEPRLALSEKPHITMDKGVSDGYDLPSPGSVRFPGLDVPTSPTSPTQKAPLPRSPRSERSDPLGESYVDQRCDRRTDGSREHPEPDRDSPAAPPFRPYVRPNPYTSTLREKPAKSFRQQLKAYNGRLNEDKWVKALARPLILFSYPAVLWSAAVYSCSIGWLIVISESVALIYRDADSYNFNAMQTGLVYISPFIGGILGTAVAGKVSDVVVKAMSRANGGLYEPEFRLVMTIPVAISTVIGLMGFGWSAQVRDNWIVPTIFFGVVSFGCSLGSTTSITFCVDSYRQYAGEALVTLNFSKNIFHGLVFSLFVTKWISTDGPKSVYIWIGIIQLVLLFSSVPMYIFGKRARMWTVRKNLIEKW